jgi:hypothetical protein
LCLRFLEYQILSKTLISSRDELSLGQNKIWENDISRNEYTFKIVETSFQIPGLSTTGTTSVYRSTMKQALHKLSGMEKY